MAEHAHVKIELQDVLNTSEGRFEYLGEDTLVSRVGGALFFFSLSTHKQHALRFPAGYSLDAWTVSNQTAHGHGEQQIVVALSGQDTRIHVYSWPRLHLEQSYLSDTEVVYSRLALSRDGRFLVGLSSESHTQLRYWDLQAPDIDIQLHDVDAPQTNRLLRERDVRLNLQEEMTFLQFNPFNHTQLVVGNERGTQVVTISAATSFQLATLTPQVVSIDVSRRITAVVWMSDRQLLLATRGGEILSVSMHPPASVLALREREVAANQSTNGGADTPSGVERERSASAGGASTPHQGGRTDGAPHASHQPHEIELGLSHLTDADLAILGLVDPQAPAHTQEDWKSADAKGWKSASALTPTVWVAGLPTAPATPQEDDHENHEEKEDGSTHGRRVVPASHIGAVATCLALTRYEVVVGTHDGCLVWLSKRDASVTHQQQVDVSGGGEAGLLAVSFSPTYATFVALTRRGHLRLFKPLADRAASAAGDSPFQSSSLGHFPIAAAALDSTVAPFAAPAQNTAAAAAAADGSAVSAAPFSTLPPSLLRTRTPIRVGHVHVPTSPSDLALKNLRLVSFTSRGVLQLWAYGVRALLATYHFKSGITACAVSPDGHLALVGLESGVLNILDMSNPAYPMRLIFSHRLHSGPLLALEFSPDGELFATMGPKKVFFVRSADFKVVGYTKLGDWLTKEDEKEQTEDDAAATAAEATKLVASTPGESSSSFTGLSATGRPSDADTQQAALVALQAEKARHDDDDELVDLDSVTGLTLTLPGGKVLAPPKDLLVAMCWSTPVDRERLPNDRLVLATRRGCVVVLTAPNIYHDAPELKLAVDFLRPVVTRSVLGDGGALTSLQANLSDRTVLYATCTDKLLRVYSLQYDSTLKCTRELNDDAPADDIEEVGPDGLLHQRAPTVICQALTGNLLLTSGRDGLVVMRDGESLEYLTRFPIHDYIVGGTCSVGVSPDTLLLTTSGFDGSLVVFDLAPLVPQIGTRRSRKLKNLLSVIQVKVLEQLNEVDECAGEAEPSYLQTQARTSTGGKQLKQHDLQQKVLKDELQKSLHTFKLQFNEILQRNAHAPDLERLGYADFAIDLELKEFLQREGDARIAAIREQIHSECVGKEYIIDRIKQQCWSAMEVKGAMFTAFKTDLEVYNYPVRALAAREARKSKQIQFLRRIELVEQRWRHNQQLKIDEDVARDRTFHPQRFTEESQAYLMNMEVDGGDGDEKATGGGASGDKKASGGSGGGGGGDKKDDKKDSMKMAKKDQGKLNSPTNASSSSSSGGAAGGPTTASSSSSSSSADLPLDNLPRFLLYHPLDVITPYKKRTQAYLLNLKIEWLKKNFNDVFQEYYEMKQREIEHIHEKAKRIQEIQNELQMDLPVYKPALAPEEIPASVLTVDDSEVKAPKVLSKAERAAAAAKAARDKSSSESADDGPERALELMMNGTLVKTKDLSFLEQELIPDEWMKTVPPDQMTEEQKIDLAKFEAKVKIIQAEQETRRKLLQTELSKLKADVSDIAKNFDAKFKAHLGDHRITVQREMYQHELMIIKLVNDLVVEEEKAREEREVHHKVAMLLQASQVARALRSEFERTYRSSQQQYETMVGELKNQDRQFRKDLQNGGVSAEQQQQIAQEMNEAQAERQEWIERQEAQMAVGSGDLLDEEGRPLPPPDAPVPSLTSAGENLDALYKLFRSKKQTKAGKGGKKQPKMQIDAITGRAVRAGSGIGRLGLLSGLASTAAPAAAVAGAAVPSSGTPEPTVTGRSNSRERDGAGASLAGTSVGGLVGAPVAGSGAAAIRKRRKDDDESGDGTMNPYPTDLLSHLSQLYLTHASSIAPGPNPQLLDDVKYVDLDDRDRPESVGVDLWYVLLERRQDYIEHEREVRRYHYKLQEMGMHVGHLQEMERALENELQALQHYATNLAEARTIFSLNTEILLRIQQGQVEIEESPVVTDLKDCEMIDRVQVEKLNAVIKRQGGEKVEILRDTTVSRTAINLLEWTRKKLELEHADSVDLTTELQLLRVTKSLQSLIKMGGHDNQKAAELKSLDRKIEFVSAANRDSLLGKKLKLMKVKKRIKQQNRENERLYETVQELEAAVKERMQISSIRDEGRLEESRAGAERMKSLVTRRKLVDLAKLQSEEIKFLRDQTSSLRRRTFASFAIPQLAPNPDERAKTSYAPVRPSPPGKSHQQSPQQARLLPPASAGGVGLGGLGATSSAQSSSGQYHDSSRPHTTLPGIGRDASSSRAAGMFPPVRAAAAATTTGGSSAADRAVTR